MNKKTEERLISIVTTKRKLHEDPRILVPDPRKRFLPSELFDDSEKRRILELGSGWGEFCVEWKKVHRDDQYVALEVKGDRIKKFIGKIDRNNLEGIKILPINFNWFLEAFFPENTFDLCIINFPDPWPKKRHWKHRLVQQNFPEKMSRLLKAGGVVYLATDYGPYARKILSIFRKRDDFESVFDWPGYLRTRPADYPSTRFETIHLADQKRPYYMAWRKKV